MITPPSGRPPLARRGDPWRTVALAALGGLALTLPLALWALRQLGREPVTTEVRAAQPPGPGPELLPLRTLAPARFEDLAGWSDDRQAEALAAFRLSCDDGVERGGELALLAGEALAAVCARLASVPANDDAAARAFFEREFTPWAIADRDDREGLLTGYYEPELAGSRSRRPPYLPPALPRSRRPDDRRPRRVQARPRRTEGHRHDPPRPLPAVLGPRRDRAGRAARPAARAALGRRPGGALLPPDPGLGPRAPAGRQGGARRLRGAERPRLHGDRQDPDRPRRAREGGGLAADDPRLAARRTRRSRRADEPEPLLRLLPRRSPATPRSAPKASSSPPAAPPRSTTPGSRMACRSGSTRPFRPYPS